MLKRILVSATIFVSISSNAMAFEVFDQMLGIAHDAPWPVKDVEAEMRALSSVTPNLEAMDRSGIARKLDDEHFWISGMHLTVPMAASQARGIPEARGMLACSRIGHKGWAIVMEQAQEPFVPFSSEAAGRIDFLGFFSDDPQPFPEGAYLRLECKAALSPLFSTPLQELEDTMARFADRLGENYANVSTSKSAFRGLIAPPLAGVVASGGADFGSYRLDSVKTFMDAGGILILSFSAWAMLNPS